MDGIRTRGPLARAAGPNTGPRCRCWCGRSSGSSRRCRPGSGSRVRRGSCCRGPANLLVYVLAASGPDHGYDSRPQRGGEAGPRIYENLKVLRRGRGDRLLRGCGLFSNLGCTLSRCHRVPTLPLPHRLPLCSRRVRTSPPRGCPPPTFTCIPCVKLLIQADL